MKNLGRIMGIEGSMGSQNRKNRKKHVIEKMMLEDIRV